MKSTSLSNAIKLAVALAGCGWSVAAQPPQDGFSDCRSDPDHFTTWDGTNYDYHGGCKVVLVKDATVDIHVNTVAKAGHSVVDQVGLRVGTDVADLGLDKGGAIPSSLGEYPLAYNDFEEYYELTLSDGQFVRVDARGASLGVHVRGLASDFGSAAGMCGTWGAPGLMGRTVFAAPDGDAMGDEWRVDRRLDDPFIGSDASCKHMDSPFVQERLLSDDFCAPRKPIKRCERKGGECVFNCVEDDDHICNGLLCGETDNAPPRDPMAPHTRKNKKKDRCACRYPRPIKIKANETDVDEGDSDGDEGDSDTILEDACAPLWTRCGGEAWTGPTCCQEGACLEQHPNWYVCMLDDVDSHV